VGLWTWLSSRPSLQRVARVTEQLAADALIAAAFMVIIYLISVLARWLHVDREEIAFGYTIAHMIRWLHATNFAINGYYAFKHLIAAHRTNDGH